MQDGGEQLSEAELEHRKQMEYNEDDENEPEEIHLREAAVSIPNIPKPHSSDGDVRTVFLVRDSASLILFHSVLGAANAEFH